MLPFSLFFVSLVLEFCGGVFFAFPLLGFSVSVEINIWPFFFHSKRKEIPREDEV